MTYRVGDVHPQQQHRARRPLVGLWLRFRIWCVETRLMDLEEIEIGAWQAAGELSAEVAALKVSLARMRALVREGAR